MLDTATFVEHVKPDDIVLLHLSVGSPVNRLFATLNCRKVILYHNITPAHYFRLCNPLLADDLTAGRQEAAALAGAAAINLADSAYNAAELLELGYGEVGVLPLFIDLAAYAPQRADAALQQRLTDGTFNLLFVGRCVPNKRIEDLLATLHYLQRHVEPRVRLIHVGAYDGMESYRSQLLAQARTLDLRDLQMVGAVSQEQLNAYYASADLFLCLSEHEGFCAPLIEAMLHDLPILARRAAAVPETLDGAGILFDSPLDLPLIAETIGRVLHDKPLREAVVARQQQRIAAFRQRDLAAELQAALAPIL